MKTQYSITKNVLIVDEHQMFVTYGIVAEDENGEKLSEFTDVSVNRKLTENIIKLLNDCRVEVCHFFEVVTDELNR